jgi:membrane-associated phospholipid phosphatase
MMETLGSFDRFFFFLINHDLRNGFFDFLLPLLRVRELWYPLYIIAGVWLIYKFRWMGLFLILAAVLNFAITDFVSNNIKKSVKRPRPCHNMEIQHFVTVRAFGDKVPECGGKYGFISSHAANHFGLAMIFGLFFIRKYRWLLPAALCWAALISISQVYVGLHYPADVLGGAIFGCLSGLLITKTVTTKIRIE